MKAMILMRKTSVKAEAAMVQVRMEHSKYSSSRRVILRQRASSHQFVAIDEVHSTGSTSAQVQHLVAAYEQRT
jgi:beta-xylosidase